MKNASGQIEQTISALKLQVRPNCGHGSWVQFLLPLAVITSWIKHKFEASMPYTASAVICIGFLIISTFTLQTKRTWKIQVLLMLPTSIIFVIINTMLHQGLLHGIITAYLSTYGYITLHLLLLRKFSCSFSWGEAALVTQGIILIFCSACSNIEYAFYYYLPRTTSAKVSLIISMVSLFVASLSGMLYIFRNCKRKPLFYIIFVLTFLLTFYIPAYLFLQHDSITWVLSLIIKDTHIMKLFIFWFGCCTVAVIAIRRQIQGARKASSQTRKIFHILVTVVYIPGLLNECTFLYLSSALILALLILIDILRILDIPPLGKILEEGFMIYSDEKDMGTIALTPIYLLIGCSLPLWIHPAPCDLTDSVGFNILPLFSGIITVGVGDSAASLIGSLCGRHKWSGSKKSWEGTIACIVSQGCLIYVFIHLGFLLPTTANLCKSILAIIVVSLIEAKSTQIDNLVLPLVMYIIVICL